MQTLFVQRLHEVEATGDAPGLSTQGLPQKELLSWYFDKMVERCALPACQSNMRCIHEFDSSVLCAAT